MCDVEKNEGAAKQLQTIKLGAVTMTIPNNEIATALAKAQGAIMNAKKTAENPWYGRKYAALDEVWDSARQPLSENGLAFTQWPSVTPTGEIVKWYDKDSRPREAPGALVTVLSLLEHSSGQFKVSEYTMPSIFDVQKIGSAITYARRYSMMSILGIAPEDDDDGNEASMQGAPGGNNQQQQQQQKKPQQTQKPAQQTNTQTKPQQLTQNQAQPPVKNQAPAQASATQPPAKQNPAQAQPAQATQTAAAKAKAETEKRVAEEKAKMQQAQAAQNQAKPTQQPPVQAPPAAATNPAPAQVFPTFQLPPGAIPPEGDERGFPRCCVEGCGKEIVGYMQSGKLKAQYCLEKLQGYYCDDCGKIEKKRREDEAKRALLPDEQEQQAA